MNILVINAGSSSLKYQLLNPDTKELLAKGLCERIGIDGQIKHSPCGKDSYSADISMPTHSEAIAAMLRLLVDAEYGVIKDISEINAVGHRVVHGGEAFSKSVLINEPVMKALDACIPLAPLHNPANITGILACQKAMPGIPNVAVFDTAFHQTIPAKAFIYALPYEYYAEKQVRRYGFHGTSHRYVSERAAEILGRPITELKLVSCHLGNGSSVAAIKGGKSIDTSMGFTPLDGLPMGTRSGAVDPSILEYIMNLEHLDIHQMIDILNKKSGVLGISGISSDFRDLGQAADKGNERAQLAIDVFTYKVTKRIGSAAAAMGGIDAVIFTAGVGENAPELRAQIVNGLEYMGLKLDSEKNKTRGVDAIVSTDDSLNKILVVPTNEELVIALDTAEIVSAL